MSYGCSIRPISFFDDRRTGDTISVACHMARDLTEVYAEPFIASVYSSHRKFTTRFAAVGYDDNYAL